jgi:imidazolonepropionase-like amidohydrolase
MAWRQGNAGWSPREEPLQTVIYADRLFDGTGAEPIDQAVVVVDDGRISAVGRRGELPEPVGGAEVARYDGCTILPGLIDCHVHLCFSASGQPLADLLAEDDQALLLRAAHNAQLALRAGVTTVKDLGGRGGVTLALRDAIASGLLPGARVLAAGPPVTTTGGHCFWLGGEADTAAELRKKVRQLHREGVDLIKVMSSGGRMTVGSNVCAAQYTIEELTALVGEARRLNKSVAAHGHGAAGIRNAVAAGVNVVEHCSWVSEEAGNRVAYDERVAEQMARQGTFMDPTLTPATLSLQQERAVLTEAQRESREIRPHVLAAHRRSLELGVEIAAGTDAGVGTCSHDRLPTELQLYVELLGLSPAQAIRAGTYNVARSALLEAELGSLQPGRRADLLIVPGNPLDDLSLLDAPRAVYKDGRLEVEQGRLVRC